MQLSRLTVALDILFPDRPRAGVASIQAAIDKLEESRPTRVNATRLQALARVLAHAYEHDSRPPAEVVRDALAFPVMPESL